LPDLDGLRADAKAAHEFGLMARHRPRGSDDRGGADEPGAAARALQIRAAAFQAAEPAHLVLDGDDVLVVANDLARRTFGLTANDLGRPVQELALFTRPIELAEHLDPARRSRTTNVPLARWQTTNGERLLKVRITPLTQHGRALGTSITYTDLTAQHELEEQLADTRRQLARRYQHLQSVVEQFEIKLEEARSLSELLATTSDDLLSATERLETVDDKLRSADHERTLLSNELHRRDAELADATALLATILDTVNLPVTNLEQPSNGSGPHGQRDMTANGRARLTSTRLIPGCHPAPASE
jgi:two-component system, chemotaxis family, CheB/CheR fusion protein